MANISATYLTTRHGSTEAQDGILASAILCDFQSLHITDSQGWCHVNTMCLDALKSLLSWLAGSLKPLPGFAKGRVSNVMSRFCAWTRKNLNIDKWIEHWHVITERYMERFISLFWNYLICGFIFWVLKNGRRFAQSSFNGFSGQNISVVRLGFPSCLTLSFHLLMTRHWCL